MSSELSPKQEELLEQTLALLDKYGLKPRKSLGQNFLIDDQVIPEMIAAAEIGPADSVLEIGPGLGVLTRALVQQAGHVLAWEKDQRLAEALRKEFGNSPRLTIQAKDVRDLLKDDRFDWPSYKVVANLPFYLTSPLILGLINRARPPAVIVVMVQKEVAERICAQPPDSNRLAVICQFKGRCQMVRSVPAESFWPRPEVDAAVLRIDRISEEPLDPALIKLIEAGFSAPRKTLANNLSGRLQLDKNLIVKCGLPPQIRAERLSLEDWLRLRDCFLKEKSKL